MQKIRSPVSGKKINVEGVVNNTIQTKNYNIIREHLVNKLITDEIIMNDEKIDIFCKKIKEKVDFLIHNIYKLKEGGVLILGDTSHGDSLQEFLLTSFFTELLDANPDLKQIISSSVFFTENIYQTSKLHANKIGSAFIGLDDVCNINYGSTNSSMIKKRNYEAHIKWSEIINNTMSKEKLNIICVGRSHIYNTKNIRKNGVEIYAGSLQSFLNNTKIEVCVLSNTNLNFKDNYNKSEIKNIKNNDIYNIFFFTHNSIIDESELNELSPPYMLL